MIPPERRLPLIALATALAGFAVFPACIFEPIRSARRPPLPRPPAVPSAPAVAAPVEVFRFDPQAPPEALIMPADQRVHASDMFRPDPQIPWIVPSDQPLFEDDALDARDAGPADPDRIDPPRRSVPLPIPEPEPEGDARKTGPR